MANASNHCPRATRRQIIGAALALAAPSLRPSPAHATGPSSDQIIIRKKYTLQNIDPIDYKDDDELISRSILAALIRPDPADSSKWILHAAEQISQPSPTEVKFTLLNGNRWYRGSGTVTAQDAKYAYKRFLDANPAAAHQADWAKLDDVIVVDDRTATIRLKAPDDGLWQAVLPFASGCIISQNFVEGLSGKRFTTDPGPASGRYYLSDANVQQPVIERNPNWARAPAKVKRVKFVVEPNDNTAAQLVMKGDIHYMSVDAANRDDWDLYRPDPSNKNIRLQTRPNLTTSQLVMNTAFGPLQDIRLRQAIQSALDPNTIVRACYDITAHPANGLVPQALLGRRDQPSANYDMARAKARLSQASHIKAPLQIYTGPRATPPGVRERIAEVVQQQLRELGLDVRMIPEWPQRAKPTDVDMYIRRWWIRPDPNEAVTPFRSSSPLNILRYNSPQYDNLLAYTEREPVRRDASYQKLQDLLEQDAAVVYIGQELTAIRYNAGLRPVLTPWGEVADLGDFGVE